LLILNRSPEQLDDLWRKSQKMCELLMSCSSKAACE
jgi:hypothetical protein